jgi:deazaflavin-dependent oxidoreductase (nitroreductase family)
MPDLRALADEDFCYLTTTGRVTGRPHEIEIWFALVPERRALYMLSGGGDRSDWVKNLRRNPEVTVRIADGRFAGLAREARDAEEDELARRLLVEKYESSPGRLENWRRRALPVVVDLAHLGATRQRARTHGRKARWGRLEQESR